MNQLELMYVILYYNSEDEKVVLKILNNDRFEDIMNYFELKELPNKAIKRMQKIKLSNCQVKGKMSQNFSNISTKN